MAKNKTPNIPVIYKLVNKLKLATFAYIQKQMQLQKPKLQTADKLAKFAGLEQTIARLKLQAQLNLAGSDEPIENYYIDGKLLSAAQEKQYEQDFQFETYAPEAHYIVRTNPYRISVQAPDEPLQKGRWRSLRSVVIEVEDLGPIEADIWLVIKTDDGDCRFPDGAMGSAEVIEQLYKLDGFDHEVFIKAMACGVRANFTVYSR
ncbi:MAG: hypothetical protein HRU29_03585 [Rhizobiales bacterium]|nr:hypothetical protein [Hyphomicrobiales bacterium]NRB13461.1 hypothetical protein [Hyphomicrobiales bacterium]